VNVRISLVVLFRTQILGEVQTKLFAYFDCGRGDSGNDKEGRHRTKFYDLDIDT